MFSHYSSYLERALNFSHTLFLSLSLRLSLYTSFVSLALKTLRLPIEKTPLRFTGLHALLQLSPISVLPLFGKSLDKYTHGQVTPTSFFYL